MECPPFFALIFCCMNRYMPRMIRLERMYMARTPRRTFGSSKGIFLDTCIIPSMITRLVLYSEDLSASF